MTAADDWLLGEIPPGIDDLYRRGLSAIPAILDHADRATAHKQAIDEIRHHCLGLADLGGPFAIPARAVLAIIERHRI